MNKFYKSIARRLDKGARIHFSAGPGARGFTIEKCKDGTYFFAGYGEDRYGQVARSEAGYDYATKSDIMLFLDKWFGAHGLTTGNTGRVEFSRAN